MFSKTILITLLLSVTLNAVQNYVILPGNESAENLEKGVISSTDCGSVGGKLEMLDVEGCSATPCTLIKGKPSTWRIKFKSNVDTASMTIKASGIVLGLAVPVPLEDSNGCNFASCPIKAGDVIEGTMTVPVPTTYPSISINVRVQLIDQNNKNVICLQIPAKLST